MHYEIAQRVRKLSTDLSCSLKVLSPAAQRLEADGQFKAERSTSGGEYEGIIYWLPQEEHEAKERVTEFINIIQTMVVYFK